SFAAKNRSATDSSSSPRDVKTGFGLSDTLDVSSVRFNIFAANAATAFQAAHLVRSCDFRGERWRADFAATKSECLTCDSRRRGRSQIPAAGAVPDARTSFAANAD